jgi:cbb3-type cytochrome oxidase maturation protein
MMDLDIHFWTFLIGLCLALNGCCIFLLLVRDGQYKDPEKAKFEMLEREEKDDQMYPPEVVNV